jgi:hypothetical protein
VRHSRSVRRRVAVAGCAALLALGAAGAAIALTGPDPRQPGDATSAVTLPPPNGTFDYQLGGAYAPGPGADVVVRDRLEPAPEGVYAVCYVNAFQSQPGETADWLHDRAELVLHDADGAPVRDPDWPDEVVLDTSTASARSALAEVVGAWIDRCADSGYSAVEADNLDSFARSDGALTRGDNLALAALLVQRAHAAGLAIGQKNAAELTGAAAGAGFDFAVAEECEVYRECDAYADAYGDRVYEIEYTDNGREAYVRACAARGAGRSVILRDRDVLPAGEAAYEYESC